MHMSRALILVAFVAALGAAIFGIHRHGISTGRTQQLAVCQADKLTAAAADKTNTEAAAELLREQRRGQAQQQAKALDRQSSTGQRFEASRTALDVLFQTLDKEASYALQTSLNQAFNQAGQPDSSACDLPPERLRLWRAANAASLGAAASHPPTGQPAASPAESAPASQWQPARAGGQPPTSSQGLPPASSPTVQPAGLPRVALPTHTANP